MLSPEPVMLKPINSLILNNSNMITEPPDKDSALGSSQTGSLTPPSTTSSTSTLSDVNEFSKAQLLSEIHAYEKTIESVETSQAEVSIQNDEAYFNHKHQKVFDKSTIIEKVPSNDFVHYPSLSRKSRSHQLSGEYDNFSRTSSEPIYKNTNNFMTVPSVPTTFEQILEKQRQYCVNQLYYTNDGIGYQTKTAKTVRTKNIKLKHNKQQHYQVHNNQHHHLHPDLPPKKESKLSIYQNTTAAATASKDDAATLIPNSTETNNNSISKSKQKPYSDYKNLRHSKFRQNSCKSATIPVVNKNNNNDDLLKHNAASPNYINYSLESTATTTAANSLSDKPKVRFNEMAKVKLIEPNSKQHENIKKQLSYIKKNHKNIWNNSTHIFIDSDQECGSYTHHNNCNNILDETCSTVSTMSGLRRKMERMHRKTKRTKNKKHQIQNSSSNRDSKNRNQSFLANSMPDLDRLENQSLPDLKSYQNVQVPPPQINLNSSHIPAYARSNSSNSAFFSKLKSKIKNFV